MDPTVNVIEFNIPLDTWTNGSTKLLNDVLFYHFIK